MDLKKSTKLELLIMKIAYLDVQVEIAKKMEKINEEIKIKEEKEKKNEQ